MLDILVAKNYKVPSDFDAEKINDAIIEVEDKNYKKIKSEIAKGLNKVWGQDGGAGGEFNILSINLPDTSSIDNKKGYKLDIRLVVEDSYGTPDSYAREEYDHTYTMDICLEYILSSGGLVIEGYSSLTHLEEIYDDHPFTLGHYGYANSKRQDYMIEDLIESAGQDLYEKLVKLNQNLV